MEVEIDADRLHEDLLEHFGTMTALAHNIQSPITHGFVIGALGDIDTMYELGDYQGLVDLAVSEGFDILSYQV